MILLSEKYTDKGRKPMNRTTILTVLLVLGVHPGLAVSSEVPKGQISNPTNSQGKSSEISTSNINGNDQSWWKSQPKEKKLLYTNLTAVTAIGIWGLATWDYGSADFHGSNEGGFEQDSKYGGADKLGHFWATYTFSDALTGLYKNWGYDSQKANTYAALSAWTVQAFMELGDATSETQGFDWGDMGMNTLGALTSILMEKYPELDSKIDFRVEYIFNVSVNGVFDDYSNHYYSMVLKLDGFEVFENNFMKWVELSGGYYTRGYEDDDEENIRSLYAGISINFSRLFDQNGYKKTGKVLEYLQIPYSVPKVSHDLD